ncbi:hypothetical protein NLI96_g9326 [Meripilus lineatus]|uniref:Fungal-type protein kinase domain-containing protein n=1 Tax=Meripilus lineatus TaxID=2056292 RepID=A0AAD5YAC5_9APHY|nr:hypothetical protein NLI96_g9326 [Physisporinus lineatus]
MDSKQIRQVQKLSKEAFKTPKISTYSHLISAFTPVLGRGYVLRDTNHRSVNTEETPKFDLAIYKKHPNSHPETKCHEFSGMDDEAKRKISAVNDTRLPHIARCCPRHVVVSFDIEMGDIHAFGKTSHDPFLPSFQNAELSRGQIAKRAGFVQRHQHRIFLFTVYIYKRTARIIRWDRAGAIVTEPFNFIEDPTFLLSFLRGVAEMTPEELGYDPTVFHATKGEIIALKECTFPEGLQSLYDEAFHSQFSTIQKVIVRGAAFLIGDFHYASTSPVGRGTKGYVAYDITNKKLCYLKDSWPSSGGHPEHETYKKLQDARVKRIATCGPAGYVKPTQMTITQLYFEDDKMKLISDRQHYRIVLHEVGLPLSSYKHSGSFCVFIFQAFFAHYQAWNAGVLHRDISDTNIIIQVLDSGLRQALLVDWDLCKYKDEVESETKLLTAPTRSGAWPFVSALRLAFPDKKAHSVSDDLESFVHLITFMAVRFHVHNLTREEKLYEDFVITMYYDSYQDPQGRDIGGYHKLIFMQGDTGHFPKFKQSLGLSKLITDLLDLCCRHYTAMSSQIAEWQADRDTEEVETKEAEDWELFGGPFKEEEELASGITLSSGSEQKKVVEKRSGELVLNTHVAMYDVLFRAQKEIRRVAKTQQKNDINWPVSDKTQDQMPKRLNLRVFKASKEGTRKNMN